MHAKLRSTLSRLGGADAIVMQSIVGEELAQHLPKRDFNLQPSGPKAPNPTNESPHPTSVQKTPR